MNKLHLILVFFFSLSGFSAFAQPTHVLIDKESKLKQLRIFVEQGDFALAYPIAQELLLRRVDAFSVEPSYVNDDVHYYNILCELKLMHPVAKEEAAKFIAGSANAARASSLAYHLGHTYFLENNFEQSLFYFEQANINNLTNEMIADLKFEKAYALFNLKRFNEAKPLFNEIHQLENSKYHIPANYYYGFISYYEKNYEEALSAFKKVELYPEYQGVVPYYITEIYYFKGEKDLALSYGESILKRKIPLYYVAQLKLLLGQIYFEKKDFKKALPLLESYVQQSDKVTKEVLYSLSYSYFEIGNTEKAIEGFKSLSNESDSLGQNSMYLLGDLYLQTNQKANARAAFQFGAANNSNKLQQKVSAFNYAKLSYELGYEGVALKEMKDYLNKYPNSEYDNEAKEILVDLLAKTSNFKEALTLYESFGTPTANMQKILPRIQYGRAIELINDQEITDADALLTKVLNNINGSSLHAYANFWKGEIAYRQRKFTESIGFLNKYLSYNVPASGEANVAAAKYTIGYAQLLQENYVAAANSFESATVANANIFNSDAYLRTGDAYYMQRNYAKALTIYNKVIADADIQADYAYMQKGIITGIKSGAEKVAILSKFGNLYPGSSFIQDVNIEIAQAYIADEKFANAIPYLQQVIKSNRDGLKPRAYLKTGLAYYNNNDNANALANYNSLLKLYPQSAEADEAVAIMKDIYIEEGKTDEFIAMMKASGRDVSNNEADSLTFSAAMKKINNNDCTGAVTAFKSYISNYPNGSNIANANYQIAACYKTSKDFPNALRYFTIVTELGANVYFERSLLEKARIEYFELKDYSAAKKSFTLLRTNSINQEYLAESLRGLVRTNYYLKDYAGASDAAQALLKTKGINTDDKSVAYLVLGKSKQMEGNCAEAITAFKSAAAINKSAWGAEARYEIANCYFETDNTSAAEKAALAVIKETGSYDEWVTKSYILLGDIFMKQKDYFNAKATYESVSKNASIAELRAIAATRLQQAIDEERKGSKLIQ